MTSHPRAAYACGWSESKILIALPRAVIRQISTTYTRPSGECRLLVDGGGYHGLEIPRVECQQTAVGGFPYLIVRLAPIVDQQRFTLGSSTIIVQETVYCPTLAICVVCF